MRLFLFTVLATVVALLPSQAFALPQPVSSTVLCTTSALATPPTQLHCGTIGTLATPQVLTTVSSGIDFNSCRNACLSLVECVSFGFNLTSSQCQLFNTTLTRQGIHGANNGNLYYNHKCFASSCSTVAVTAATSASISDTSFATTSSGVLSGLYTFTLTTTITGPGTIVLSTLTQTAVHNNTVTSIETDTAYGTLTDTAFATLTDTAYITSTEVDYSTLTATSFAISTETDISTLTATSYATSTELDYSTITAYVTQPQTITETDVNDVTITQTQLQTVTATLTQNITETDNFSNTVTATQTQLSTIIELDSFTVTNFVTQFQTITESDVSNFTITQTQAQTVTATVTQNITETDSDTVTATQTQFVTSTELDSSTVTNYVTQSETVTESDLYTSTITQTDFQTTTATSTQSITETDSNTITAIQTQTVTSVQTADFTTTEIQDFTFTQTFDFTQLATSTFSQTVTATATATESVTSTTTFTESVTATATATTTTTTTYAEAYTPVPSTYVASNLYALFNNTEAQVYGGSDLASGNCSTSFTVNGAVYPCNSFDTCQDICASVNDAEGSSLCLGVSYMPYGFGEDDAEPTCFLHASLSPQVPQGYIGYSAALQFTSTGALYTADDTLNSKFYELSHADIASPEYGFLYYGACCSDPAECPGVAVESTTYPCGNYFDCQGICATLNDIAGNVTCVGVTFDPGSDPAFCYLRGYSDYAPFGLGSEVFSARYLVQGTPSTDYPVAGSSYLGSDGQSLFYQYADLDLPGDDLSNAYCNGTGNMFDTVGWGTYPCENFWDCQNVCASVNTYANRTTCYAISYTPNGYYEGDTPRCYLKYDVPDQTGQTYVVNSAVLFGVDASDEDDD